MKNKLEGNNTKVHHHHQILQKSKKLENLKLSQTKKKAHYEQRNKIKIKADLSLKAIQVRRLWSIIFKF